MTIARSGIGWGATMPWLALIALGAVIALLRLFPDRMGLWWELGTLLLTAYFLGCCLGALLGGFFGRSLGEPAKSGALAEASRPISRVMIREKERAVDPQLKPLAAAAAAPEEPVVGLAGPRDGRGDDLTKIYGIDASTQEKLNALGIYHYEQLANFTPGNRRWVFGKLGHEGRFPSWWWRWRYDAEALLKGGAAEAAEAPAQAETPQAEVSEAVVPASPVLAAAPSAEAKQGEAAVAVLPAEHKPRTLAAPEGGKADDLKRIRGIGKQNEARLHGLGIWHFHQIAGWNAEQSHWVGTYLAFPGRIEREDWVAQAKILAEGGETDFSERADAGKVLTSRDDGQDDGQSNVAVLGKDFGTDKPSPEKL